MKNKLYVIPKFVLLIIFSFFALFPFYLLINSSFKSQSELYQAPYSIVKNPTIENYITAWVEGKFYIFAKNSVIVLVVSVFFIVLLSSMAAFAITRRGTFPKFNNFIYILFLIGVFIPPQVAIIPLYLFLIRINLGNSLIGLCIALIAYGIPFGIFIMYNYFRQIPKEIEDAAKIDGCSNFSLYSKIIMPLSKSSIITVALIQGVWVWNNLIFTLVIISSTRLKTLPTGLLAFKGQFVTNFPPIFAGVMLISAPLILVFFILQKQYMEGMILGSIKG